MNFRVIFCMYVVVVVSMVDDDDGSRMFGMMDKRGSASMGSSLSVTSLLSCAR